MRTSSRRAKIARHTRGNIRSTRQRRDVELTDEPSRGVSFHWILLGASILLVAGLSFALITHLPTGANPGISFNLRGLNHKELDRAESLGNGPSYAVPATATPVVNAAMPAGPALGGSAVFNSMYDQGNIATPPPLPNHIINVPKNPVSTNDVDKAVNDILGKASLPGAAVPGGKTDESGRSSALNSLLSKISTVDVPSKNVAGSGGMAVLEGESWLKLYKDVDSREIIFGAWIFLPNAPVAAFPQSSQSMKTVAATKISGCKVGETNADGWALFVHEWGTFNQQLRLSWTDPALACNELFSETALVPFDRWVHVGFSLSEAQNSARLFLDGSLIADTQQNMGTLAKASTKVPLNQADIRSRKVVRGGGSLVYGAHLPQIGDQTHVQSHAFFGFLADMRLLHVAPPTAEEAKKVLMCGAEDLLSKAMVPASSIVVQVQFKAGQPEQANLVDGVSFTQEPESDKRVSFRPWTEKPKHPWFQMNAAAEEAMAVPLSPAPTMAPGMLQATWPVAWTAKFSTDVLMQSQRRSDAWAEETRAAMAHTWRAYTAKAWGHDDLKPVSGRPKDWCRIGIFILDALTTLWLMDLTDEFSQASAWLSSNSVPSPGSHGMHSVFEINIRGFGGLLGAYSLSGQQVFLDNARRLGDALLKAFDTPSGMPKSQIDLGTGASKWHSWVRFAVLAEVATVQVEFRYLSHVLQDDKYKKAADKAFDAVLRASGDRGLIPIYLTQNDEVPRFGNQKISLGAMGDSYYEYLIKQWVQTGKKEDRLKNKWKDAMRETLDQLVRKTEGGLTYICEQDNGQLRHRMDHLACFVGGMLMMGARELPPNEVDPRWEPTAAEITRTCHEMYKRSPTGLSPEYVVFHPEAQAPNDMSIPNDAPHNLLRPEAAEAMYYMHYYTGDPKYREWAHEMMQAFDRNAKVRFGYASVRDVRQNPPPTRDDMESFWAAETLKYLYLIQVPRSKLNMDEYVFNTEAHPLKRWQE